VEIADKFQKVGFFFAHDRLVPVLQEMPAAMVTTVERPRIPGQERPHAAGQRHGGGPYQEMKMIRHQCPGVDAPGCGLRQGGEPAYEIVPVRIIAKEKLTLDPTCYDVVQDPRGI
jgi:hypothetical protein